MFLCFVLLDRQSSYLTYTPAVDLISYMYQYMYPHLPSVGCRMITSTVWCIVELSLVFLSLWCYCDPVHLTLPVLHSLVKLSTSATSTPAFTHCIPLIFNLLLCIAVRRQPGHYARIVSSSHSVDRVSFLECY